MAAQSQSSRYAQNRNGSVEAFRVYQSGTHRVQADAQSLYPFMPLMLGRRLPQEIAAKLIAGLKEEGRFLTPLRSGHRSPLQPLLPGRRLLARPHLGPAHSAHHRGPGRPGRACLRPGTGPPLLRLRLPERLRRELRRPHRRAASGSRLYLDQQCIPAAGPPPVGNHGLIPLPRQTKGAASLRKDGRRSLCYFSARGCVRCAAGSRPAWWGKGGQSSPNSPRSAPPDPGRPRAGPEPSAGSRHPPH